MLHKRVRVDNYTSNNRTLRITGRSGYETSTDLWIERMFALKFRSRARDENFEEGWFTTNDDHYTPHYEYEEVNLAGSIDITLSEHGGLNNSLENLHFKPVGCTNHYNCYPKTQRKILPYLIPYDRWENVEFMNKYNRTITPIAAGDMPNNIWWDPTHHGNFVVTFDEGSQGVFAEDGTPKPDSMLQKGFCPRDMIEFGILPDAYDPNSFQAFNAHPYLLPVYYNKDRDELEWNLDYDVVVKVFPELFGSEYFGDADHFFRLDRDSANQMYDGDSWTAKFDRDGVAGRNAPHGLDVIDFPINPGPNAPQAAIAAYQAAEALYNARVAEIELIEHNDIYGLKDAVGDNTNYRFNNHEYGELRHILLWANDFKTRHVDTLSNIPNAYGLIAGDPDSGTNIDEMELFLWMRFPRYSKGQAFNWSMHPGLGRFTQWFDKEVNGDLNNPAIAPGGDLEELLPFLHHREPTDWYEFAYARDGYTDNIVGKWHINWTGTDPVNVNGVQHNTMRKPDQFILDLPGDRMTELWSHLQTLDPNSDVSFKLRGGPQITSAFPSGIQQLQGMEATVDPTEHRDVYIRFQKRHGIFTNNNGSHQIVFDWTYLSGVDIYGNFPNGEFPNGKPFTCSTNDIFPKTPHVDGWIADARPGRSLDMALNQNDFTNLHLFYTSNAVEEPYVWNEGSKPLFTTEGNDQYQYQIHEKQEPTDNDDGSGESGIFFKMIDSMFRGDVIIETAKLEDYRSVLLGRNRSEITIREPLFGLESGMSTYGVKRIFNNKPWYSLLLQDIDLYFQPTDSRAKIFAPGLTDLEITDHGIVTDLVGVYMEIEDTTAQTSTVTVRTRDGRDQRTKLLLEVSNPYPFLRLYKGFTQRELDIADTPTVTISIYSERGVPDWFFIYAEREFPANIDYLPEGNPIISGLNFFARTNKNRSLCDYMLSKHELWQATRRNSHPDTDMEELHNLVGGVLLGKEDLGTLEFDEFTGTDCFDYDVVVTLENEPTVAGDVAERVSLSIIVTICAIYENGVVLKGGGTKLSFVEIKETNY